MKNKTRGAGALRFLFCAVLYSIQILWGLENITQSDIEAKKQQRQFNKEHFDYVISDLQNCIKMSKNISSAVTNTINEYQKKTLDVKKLCDISVITNAKQYESCLSAQRDLSIKLDSLIGMLSRQRDVCSRTKYPNLIPRLKTLSKELEKRTLMMIDNYVDLSMSERHKKRAKKAQAQYSKSMKPLCNLKMLSYLEKVYGFRLSAFLSSDLGDMYDFQKSLKAINILKDSANTLMEVCKINNNNITKINEAFQEAKSYQKPFSEMSQKICGFLDPANALHRELCRTPLNNDSWKYSVHKAFTQYTEEKIQKREQERAKAREQAQQAGERAQN